MQSKASRTLFYRFVFVQAHLLARNGRGFNRRRRDPWELSELTISESRAVVWVLMTSMRVFTVCSAPQFMPKGRWLALRAPTFA